MKQTFEIPEGCKVVTVEQIGNQLITSFEPEKYEPKVGDCVKIIYPSGNTYFCEVADVHGYQVGGKNVEITPDGVNFKNDIKYLNYDSIEKITPEEFQAEFEKLGYVYDFETHTASKKRWRAEYNKYYHFVSGAFIVERVEDRRIWINDSHYKAGNYFEKVKDAEDYRDYMLQHSLNYNKK